MRMLHAVHPRPNRHSIFDLDPSLLSPQPSSTTPVSSSTSCESLHSSNSSGKLRDRTKRMSYNARIFGGMKKIGQRPLADDIQETRREARDQLSDSVDRQERRRVIEEALSTLEQLALFLPEQSQDESDILFIFEYTAFLSWAYTTIRFSGFIGDMAGHFRDLKDQYRRVLPSLPSSNEHRYLAALRFSQLCLEYAEVCDEEGLSWCRIALTNLTELINDKSAEARVATGNDGMMKMREVRRLTDMAERLAHNINQIEYTWTIRIPVGGPVEKLV